MPRDSVAQAGSTDRGGNAERLGQNQSDGHPMTDALNVITICGSLRKGSFNAMLAQSLPALAPSSMTISPAPPIGTLPLYNFDVQQEHGFPAPALALADAIRAADGVILVTPEYNYSIPGVLKNAIDWLSRVPQQPFLHKPVAIQSASPSTLGGARAQYHLRQVLVFLDALVFNRPEIMVTFANTKVDEAKGEITDEPTREIIRQQLAGFAKFILRVKPGS
jgi:chromate reductase, NAD(P)H dehydrogenase (quinone)